MNQVFATIDEPAGGPAADEGVRPLKLCRSSLVGSGIERQAAKSRSSPKQLHLADDEARWVESQSEPIQTRSPNRTALQYGA